MKLLKTIVVAVDFDDTAGDVLAAGLKLAKQFKSELVLLHVIEAPEEAANEHGGLPATVLSRLEDMRAELAVEGIVSKRASLPLLSRRVCYRGVASILSPGQGVDDASCIRSGEAGGVAASVERV